MIKAVFNVCPNYNSCFARRMTLLAADGDSHCLECDLYRSYSLGFSEGAKQAVDAINYIQSRGRVVPDMLQGWRYEKGGEEE